MKKVRIISGTYGLRLPGDRVDPKTPASAPFEVSDEEAARLVRLNVAEVVHEAAPAPDPEIGQEEEIQVVQEGLAIEDMTVGQLKELADQMGLEYKSRATKAQMIELISNAAGDGETESEEEGPELGAADIVD